MWFLSISGVSKVVWHRMHDGQAKSVHRRLPPSPIARGGCFPVSLARGRLIMCNIAGAMGDRKIGCQRYS